MTVSILWAIIGLGVVLFAHELGHFIGAKAGGMRIRQFALGFGWRLFGFKGRETDYRLNAIPLGGYVMVDGLTGEESDPAVQNDPRMMQNRPAWARALYAVSGPAFNFILAFLLVLGIALFQGVPSGTEVVVGAVESGSPAHSAGVLTGDVVLRVDGKEPQSPADVGEMVRAAKGPVQFAVRRAGQSLHFQILPREGRVGVQITGNTVYTRQGATPGAILSHTFGTLSYMSTAVLRAFGALFSGHAKLSQFSGPVGMVSEVAATARAGLAGFLMVLAFISVNLGLFNLLPFPALDGGRLILLALERWFGLKLSQTRQAVIHLIGFAVMFILLAIVSVQDILRVAQ